MTGNSVIILNMSLYVMLLCFCIYKYKWHNLGSFLSLLYAISSVAALLLYNSPLYHITYRKTNEPAMDGCLCLFIINSALILTFSHFKLSKYICVYNYNPYGLKQIQKAIILLLSVYLLFYLPSAVWNYFTTSNLARMRDSFYGVRIEQRFFIISLIQRVFGSMPIFLITITGIRLFLFRQMDNWDRFSMIIYLLMSLNGVFSVVSRSSIVFSIFEIVALFIVFYPFLSKRIKKSIFIYSAILLPILLSIFLTISVARFGSFDKVPKAAWFATLRYAGESQLNFMTWLYPDLKESFHGYKQLSLFRRVLGIEYENGLGRKGTSLYNIHIKNTYKYKHPFYMFYGVAGDLVMNWGRITTMFLVVITCIFLRRLYKKEKVGIPSFFIILAVVLSAYYAKGIFYSDYQFESGNFLILFLFILYFFLKYTGKTYLIKNIS